MNIVQTIRNENRDRVTHDDTTQSRAVSARTGAARPGSVEKEDDL